MPNFEIEETPAPEGPRDPAEEYILTHPICNQITNDLAKVLLSRYSRQEDKNRAIVDAFAAVETRLNGFGQYILDNQ